METTVGSNPPKPARKPKPINPLREKVVAIRDYLDTRTAERDSEINGMLVAALAGEHCLLIGPPGTAKSQLARDFSSMLSGAAYFEWLLTRFTTPEEIYGPISFSAMKQDRYARVMTGKLPEAHVAFIDEIFKANSGLLNSLLGVVNERVFHDDGIAKRIPLLTCIGASNELPESTDLAAIYDRFVVRFMVSPLKSEDNFAAMLVPNHGQPPEPLTLAEWSQARAEVDAMPISPKLVQAIWALRSNLASVGISHSDRRWVKSLRIMRAQAWLANASTVSASHLRVLSSVLWDRPEQIAKVNPVITQMAGAEILTAEKIVEANRQFIQQLGVKRGSQWTSAASGARLELKKAIDRITELREGTDDEEVVTALDGYLSELRAKGRELTQELKKEMKIEF